MRHTHRFLVDMYKIKKTQRQQMRAKSRPEIYQAEAHDLVSIYAPPKTRHIIHMETEVNIHGAHAVFSSQQLPSQAHRDTSPHQQPAAPHRCRRTCRAPKSRTRLDLQS
jgi:hypothetical protein